MARPKKVPKTKFNFVALFDVKKCIDCDLEKLTDSFILKKDGGYVGQCKSCTRIRNQKYYEENRKNILNQKHEYYEENKEYYHEYGKEYREKNKERLNNQSREYRVENTEYFFIYRQLYYQENREEIIENNKNYAKNHKEERNLSQRERLKNDPSYRLRGSVSNMVNFILKNNNSSKKGYSISNFLPENYFEEIKTYLESLFESWMGWENQGEYVPELWNKEDSLSMKWQLDHVIPQSYLPYDSMDHPNFKKAWCLKNLRPLDAKQNIKEGNRIKPDQDVEKMTQEEFEIYIEVYLENYNKQKGKTK